MFGFCLELPIELIKKGYIERKKKSICVQKFTVTKITNIYLGDLVYIYLYKIIKYSTYYFPSSKMNSFFSCVKYEKVTYNRTCLQKLWIWFYWIDVYSLVLQKDINWLILRDFIQKQNIFKVKFWWIQISYKLQHLFTFIFFFKYCC